MRAALMSASPPTRIDSARADTGAVRTCDTHRDTQTQTHTHKDVPNPSLAWCVQYMVVQGCVRVCVCVCGCHVSVCVP